jgi:hypothetical protein
MTNKKEHSFVWDEWFYYDETSPSGLRWNKDIYNVFGVLTRTRKGMVAGSKDVHGHWRVQVQRTPVKVHRIIFEMFNKGVSYEQIDHINGVRCDNRIANLRGVTRKENAHNMKKPSKNTSGIVGVSKAVVTQSNGRETPVWRADWTDETGKRHTKSFSCDFYSDTVAYEMAVKARKDGLESANKNGAGYTERHGT